ncbi:hypothetical protein KJ910_01280 [Patescibacteria group bacterium]|nr:hypothetical protein [Patescibacteria group bacterium]MBU1907347.1 hypothetical protein [Patescibacteria group bacterium]
MKKKFFKCRVCGDIHFGLDAPAVCPTCKVKKSYEAATGADANTLLANLQNKKLWRCFVCNDLHIGIDTPQPCPTCQTNDAYVEITQPEFIALYE